MLKIKCQDNSNDSANDNSDDSGSESDSSDSSSDETSDSTDLVPADDNTPAPTDDSEGDVSGTLSDTRQPSFWDKNKKWITPTGIAVGTLGLIALVYHLLKPKAKPKPQSKALLSGMKSKKKQHVLGFN